MTHDTISQAAAVHATPARRSAVRRVAAVAITGLALLGASVPAAHADPQNIQKPGHLA